VVFVGLEVQVGGARVDRVDQHLLQEAHDRRVRRRRWTQCPASQRGTSSVTSNSKSPDAIDSILVALCRCTSRIFESCLLDDDPYRASTGRELDALRPPPGVGRRPPITGGCRASQDHHLVLRGELAFDDVAPGSFCTSTAFRSSNGIASALARVCESSVDVTAPAQSPTRRSAALFLGRLDQDFGRHCVSACRVHEHARNARQCRLRGLGQGVHGSGRHGHVEGRGRASGGNTSH
jgi:hypothetical protein